MGGGSREKEQTSAIETKSPNQTLLDRWDDLVSWIWSKTGRNETLIKRSMQTVLRVVFIVCREFQSDRIVLRASALTFTVILSMVPILALGTAVLKGLGAGEQMREAAYRFVDQLETTEDFIGSTVGGSTDVPPQSAAANKEQGKQVAPAAAQGREPATTEKESLTVHLRKAVDQIFDYVDRTNFAALGAFGIAGLVITVISVLGSIEQAMNTIWQAKSDRPFGRKLIDYLALMILLPLSVNLALATEATIQSPRLMGIIKTLLPMAWMQHLLLNTLPLIAIIATFSILYQFLPNAKIKPTNALVGGAVGGLCWLMTQGAYITLQIGVAKYNAIYGSFATLPLFLVWVYIGWVVFLLGAEVAFAMHVYPSYRWFGNVVMPVNRLAVAFDVMSLALSDFRHRQPTNVGNLAYRLEKPAQVVEEVTTSLEAGGLLLEVQDKIIRYVPATEAEELNPIEVFDLILGKLKSNGDGKDNILARKAVSAARAAVDGKEILGSCFVAANGDLKQGDLFNK